MRQAAPTWHPEPDATRPIPLGRGRAIRIKHAPRLKRNNVFGALACFFGVLCAAQPAQTAPATPPAVPTPAEALAAYQTVDAWVRAAAIPGAERPIDLPASTAVSVTLRRGGRVIGRGTSVMAPATPPEALRNAAGQAWVEASERLITENDALRDQRLRESAAVLTIDLELAGRWTPIGGDTFVEAAAEVTPGIDGIGARVGDRLVSVFPGAMLSANREPSQAILSAAGALDLPPLPLKQLRDNHGLVVYRFPVTRLAQTNPDSPPIFLFRGGRVTPISAVSAASMRTFADRLATNMLGRHWPGEQPMGLMDTIRPWIGDYEEPVIASPRSQALAALALTRWASLKENPAAQHAAVAALLQELAELGPEEDNAANDIASAAMTLYAINEAQRAGVWGGPPPLRLTRLRSVCRDRVESVMNDQRSVGAPVLALVACAAASDGVIDRSATEQLVRALLRGAAPQELPALSPWVGWAELALHADGSSVPSAIALREHRSILWRHQIDGAGAGAAQPDLVGGIVFTAARHPEPSWQTARALALVATMLGDDRLTNDDERLPEVVRLTRAVRFLMELTMDGTDVSLVPASKQTAVGAVRNSLTDMRAPLDATSMTLLTVCEAIKAFEQAGSGR